MTARRATARGRRRTAEEARDEIVEVAFAFLAKHRLRDLTVARLMAGTSIGRSAFYAYFGDVYRLTEALLDAIRDEFLAAAAPWLLAPAGSVESLRASLSGVIGVWRRRGRVLRAIQDAATQDAKMERAFRRALADLEGVIAAAIRREQSAGRVGALDPDETASALNYLDLAYLDHCYGRASRRDPEVVLATLEHIWIRTLYGDSPTACGVEARVE